MLCPVLQHVVNPCDLVREGIELVLEPPELVPHVPPPLTDVALDSAACHFEILARSERRRL